MQVFSTTPGAVALLLDPRALPLAVTLQDWGNAILTRSAIQKVGIRSSGNYQFLHTLRNFIYVYVFGEKVGDLTISGISFGGFCGDAYMTGPSGLIYYYNTHAISATGMPVEVQIGAAGFYAFLTDIEIDTGDPVTSVGTFTMAFKLLPGG